jgi:hypothetical protein
MSPITRLALASAVALSFVGVAFAQTPSLLPLTTFGGGDGWRSPGEAFGGDTAGTATAGVYNYLGTTTNNERGLAFNPSTKNLILVSRSGANTSQGTYPGLRILSSTTGVDLGRLNDGIVTPGTDPAILTGGTNAVNMVGVTTAGVVYVNNLSINTGTTAYKVYSWGSEAALAPTVFHNATVAVSGTGTGTPRMGDSFDVFGSGATTLIASGFGSQGTSTANSVNGYSVINSSATLKAFNPLSGAANGDHRLGITFYDSDTLIGAQNSASFRLSDFDFSLGTATLAGTQSYSALSGNSRAMDVTTVDGKVLIAILDTGSSSASDSGSGTLRVYDITNPLSPVFMASGRNQTGVANANANATGAVAWGDVSGVSATVYTLTSNNGVQAFTFSIPEPATLGVFAGAAVLSLARRRKA